MNYTKIQTDLLKLVSKDNNLRDFNYKVDDNRFYLIHAHYMVVIPDSEWLLDTDKVFNNKIPLNINIDKFFCLKDMEPLTLTNKKAIVDKRSLVRFVNKENQNIFIDEKLLNIFNNDKHDFLYFKGTTSKAPVYVYNCVDEWLGLILPVNYIED